MHGTIESLQPDGLNMKIIIDLTTTTFTEIQLAGGNQWSIYKARWNLILDHPRQIHPQQDLNLRHSRINPTPCAIDVIFSPETKKHFL